MRLIYGAGFSAHSVEVFETTPRDWSHGECCTPSATYTPGHGKTTLDDLRRAIHGNEQGQANGRRREMIITLKNDFHNSEAQMRMADGAIISPSQRRRAWKQLCGRTDCKCSDSLGQRGRQDHRLIFSPRSDGGFDVEDTS